MPVCLLLDDTGGENADHSACVLPAATISAPQQRDAQSVGRHSRPHYAPAYNWLMLRKTLTIFSLVGLVVSVGLWIASYWRIVYVTGQRGPLFVVEGGQFAVVRRSLGRSPRFRRTNKNNRRPEGATALPGVQHGLCRRVSAVCPNRRSKISYATPGPSGESHKHLWTYRMFL